MKHIKLLLIISLAILVNSCTSTNKKESLDSKEQKIFSIDTINTKNVSDNVEMSEDTIKNIEEDSINKVNQIKDSLQLIEKKKNDELKVIINGKVYYKKYKNDIQLGKSFIFRTKKMQDYDIRTGGYVPSGFDTGKIE